MLLYGTTCRWWSFTASHVKRQCVWSAQKENTGNMWQFRWEMCWNSTNQSWKTSWTPCATGTMKYMAKFRNTVNTGFLILIYFGRLPQLTAAIELVNDISRQLSDRKNQAVTEISHTFDELEKALHQRKTALVTEVENICNTKQKVRGRPKSAFLMWWSTLIPPSVLWTFVGASRSAGCFDSGQREHSE